MRGTEKTKPSIKVRTRLGVEHESNGTSRSHENGRRTCEPGAKPIFRYAQSTRGSLGCHVSRQVLAELRAHDSRGFLVPGSPALAWLHRSFLSRLHAARTDSRNDHFL